MRILIVGAGMYVTGRMGTGTGTVLSSLAETSKNIPIDEIVVIARSAENQAIIEKEMARINSTLDSSLKVVYEKIGGNADSDIPNICQQYVFDGAIVSVPDHLHYSYTKELLQQAVHCMVVKPLTPTTKEAKDLISRQKANNCYGVVEFHKRWDETNLYNKRMFDEDKIGKLLYFTVDYSQRVTIPTEVFKGWSDKTNIFQYLGVHYVDLIYFMTGYTPVRLSAYGTNGTLKEQGINTFDSVHTTIIWQHREDENDEFLSQLNINWVDPNCSSAMSDQKYKVIGTKGRIECDQKNRGLEIVHENAGIQQINPYFSEYLPGADGKNAFSGYGHKSINQYIKDLQDIKSGRVTIENLEKLRPTFQDSLISVSVIEAVNQSLSDNSKWTKVNG